jgi:hypothetical protein
MHLGVGALQESRATLADGLLLGLGLLENPDSQFTVHRPECREHMRHHEVVDGLRKADSMMVGLTPSVDATAEIRRQPLRAPPAMVTGPHPPIAVRTEDEALQEGRSLAEGWPDCGAPRQQGVLNQLPMLA